MSQPETTIRLERDGAIARLRIERPDKRNALASAHWVALERALDQCRTARVLLLMGVPGAFSAGADIDELAELLRDPTRFAATNELVQHCQLALEHLPIPTVAVIDGVCVGGGLGLALACDFRLATSQSRFALTPGRLGLVYSPTDTRRLVNAIGATHARDLLLSGRTIEAREAHSMGLINRVLDSEALEAETVALVASLLGGSSSAAAGIKRVLSHVSGDSTVDRVQAQQAFDDAFHSADFAEGAAAFLAKRAPRFE
jgi:enoyl-CoA hydratase/carnithine racemase